MMTRLPEDEREKEKEEEAPRLDWKDFAAICIAVYQLLLPRLLAVIAGVIITVYLMLWLWR